METAVEKLAGSACWSSVCSHYSNHAPGLNSLSCLREKGSRQSSLWPAAFSVGVIIVAFHNVWHGLPIVVTIMGWGFLLKSILYLTYPTHGMRMLARVSVERSWEFVVAGVMGVST